MKLSWIRRSLLESIRIILNTVCFKSFDIIWDISICVTTVSFIIGERSRVVRTLMRRNSGSRRMVVLLTFVMLAMARIRENFVVRLISRFPELECASHSPDLKPLMSTSSGYTRTISICLRFDLLRHWNQHSLIRCLGSPRRNVKALSTTLLSKVSSTEHTDICIMTSWAYLDVFDSCLRINCWKS